MRKWSSWLLSGLLVATGLQVRADEGMWLLPYLQKLNIKEMKAKGLKLSADQIYNVNGNSLKDAIVIFGGGCTGEIVSANGLVFTNHHCGYGSIQRLSSVEHDYLENGFWAMNYSEELPCPGMSVTFIRSIEDVSDQILPKLNDSMSEEQRQQCVDSLCKAITKAALPENSTKEAFIESFFGGNQYLMFVVERYKDVRLVGTPPSSIGKFGGDTDNWMWPRHTGDFSIFRVYSDKEGKPAAYSKDNIPYLTPTHLKISLKGVKPGDYTMIMGFPGSTERYMTSYEIDQVLNISNPNRIFIRGERQKLMMEDMVASEKVRLQYANKYAGSSNYWKNSIGESRGLRKLGVKGQKEALEARFRAWVNEDPARQQKYGNALDLIKESIHELNPILNYRQYISEALLRGTEIITFAKMADVLLVDSLPNGLDTAAVAKYLNGVSNIYKDYNTPTDRKIAKRMIRIVYDSLSKEERPDIFNVIDSLYAGDVERYVDDLFDNSLFATQERFETFLNNPNAEQLKNDPAYLLSKSVSRAYSRDDKRVKELNNQYERGHRLFIAGLMEMMPDHKFYPDANFTIRLTYGQVLPYRPSDGVIYDYYTTLEGVIAKEDPSNPLEFTVPDKLKELFKNKDYGQYAEDGTLRVGFLSNNDITGGNSGSPVLNGKGELIGLAFDGNWEAMSGDVAFEPELQRTISVDIRYVLFVIEKYAGATRLIDELTLVK